MPAAPQALLKRIHLRWILVLALLLPLGQVASTIHLLTHLHGGQRTGQLDADHDDHCDLCVAAAAVLGGAPEVQGVGVAPLLPLPVPHPAADVQTLWSGIAPAHYLSRAPPSL